MKYILKLAWCVILFLLISCTKGDTDIYSNDEDIQFEISFAPQTDTNATDGKTRVKTDIDFKSTWQSGDELGVFAVEHGSSLSTSNYIHNTKITFDGTSWIPESPLYWRNDGKKLDFYAYYPYDLGMNDPKNYVFKVKIDQSNPKAYSKSDFLMANNNNNGSGFHKQSVPLQFTHALSLVQLKANNYPLPNYMDLNLFNVITNAKIDLQAQTINALTDKSTLKLNQKYTLTVGDNTTSCYWVLVPPQNINVVFGYTLNGISYKYESLPATLEKGKVKLYELNMP